MSPALDIKQQSLTHYVVFQILKRQYFAQMVKEDAENVHSREETDSIDIIDDVRFHITFSIQTYGEMEEANEKLKLIDDFLEELDLEG
jgi:ankyrin repeat/BTB/POZ domain-containing protein 1